MISRYSQRPIRQDIKAEQPTRVVTMDSYRLYEMSEPHSDIGVSLWGPGQALCFKTANMSTVSTVHSTDTL